MIQVTAILNDSEIGYGEGETLGYAVADCGASISPMFENEIVELNIIQSESLRRTVARVYLSWDGETALTY